MKAYLDNPELKDLLVKEIGWHEEQDAIIQGSYGDAYAAGRTDFYKACAEKLLSLLKESI